ncbi:MAG: MFS transporter [Bacteroidetes bacterium]|nr:MFS transporter [Bacteroidota bacterium]
MLKSSRMSIIFIVVLIDLIGFGIIIPILPHYSEIYFHANEFEIGVLIASFSFFQFLATPFLGRLSDRIGRKPVITSMLIVSFFAYLLYAFATDYWVALFARSVAGIGGGSISAAQAYIADVTEKRDRAKGMGLIGTAFGVGFVLGPFIGGALSVYGFLVPNLAAAGFSLLAFLLAYFILDESLQIKGEKTPKKSSLLNIEGYVTAFSRKETGALITIFFILTFSIANTYGTTPILGYRILKLSDAQIGYVFGVIGLVTIFVQGYLIGILTKRFSERSLLYFGISVMTIGLLLIPQSNSLLLLILFFIITVFGLAILSPVIFSLISKAASPSEQGKVLGINQSMGSLGRVLGPLWGGFAFNYFGYESPFITAGAFTFITLFIGVIMLHTSLNQQDPAID